MDNFRRSLAVLGLTLLLFSSGSNADSVGFTAGLNGLAFEYQKVLSNKLAGRGALTEVPIDLSFEQGDFDYQATIDRRMLGMLFDWHPFAGNFRLSGGSYFGKHQWSLTAKVTDQSFKIGNNNYRGENIRLQGTADFSAAAPYLGFGWSKKLSSSGFGMSFDMCLLFIGKA